MGTQPDSIRALRLPQVIDKTGISRSQLYRMAKAGTFPASHQLSDTGSVVAWNEAEIDAWLAAAVNLDDIALLVAFGPLSRRPVKSNIIELCPVQDRQVLL